MQHSCYNEDPQIPGHELIPEVEVKQSSKYFSYLPDFANTFLGDKNYFSMIEYQPADRQGKSMSRKKNPGNDQSKN